MQRKEISESVKTILLKYNKIDPRMFFSDRQVVEEITKLIISKGGFMLEGKVFPEGSVEECFEVMVESLLRINEPEKAYAYLVTERIITPENIMNLTNEDKKEWNEAIKKAESIRAKFGLNELIKRIRLKSGKSV